MLKIHHIRAALPLFALCLSFGSYSTGATELSNRITTNNNPKAKGLILQMDYPHTWGFNDGKRPNVVINAFSENGKGLEGCVTTIHINENSKGRDNYSLTREVVKSIKSNPALVYTEIGEQNRLSQVTGGNTMVDGELGIWLKGQRAEERLGLKFFSNSFITMFWYKKWIATITCMSTRQSEDEANNSFRMLDPLFKKIIFSTVIVSKWQ